MPHLWFDIHLSQWNLRIRAANARCKRTTTKNLLDLLLSSSNISKFDRLQEGLSPVMALLLTFFLNKRYMPQFSNQTNQGCNNVLGFWISQSQISFLSLSVMVHNSKTYLIEKKKKKPFFPHRMSISNACYSRADLKLNNRLATKSPDWNKVNKN